MRRFVGIGQNCWIGYPLSGVNGRSVSKRHADTATCIVSSHEWPAGLWRTAETIAAYIDDPKRFGRSSQVAAYFGLVPCQDASASVNRLGHITKQGPGTARKYLVEAAWQGVYRSPKIRAYFERILRGKKERRKIALVATAHYLLRCMHAMLINCEPWREVA